MASNGAARRRRVRSQPDAHARTVHGTVYGRWPLQLRGGASYHHEMDDDARIDFSPASKRLIAERANLRCSYLGCGCSTSGPGAEPNQGTRVGVAAHIYSAAARGPRGRGGLSDDEIALPDNGIWLCELHAKAVDANQGAGHSSELLLSYKGLHEARVRGEVLGLYPPVGWVHEVQVASSGIFSPGATARFGKLTLLMGDNATGKTALWEWITGAFDVERLWRWRSPRTPIDVRVTFWRPVPTLVRFRTSESGAIRYEIDGRDVPFNPIPFRAICLQNVGFGSTEEDDTQLIGRKVGLPTWMVESLVDEVNRFQYAHVHNLHFEHEERGGVLYLDLDGGARDKPMRLLSGREIERVMIEFATAAARVCGRYCPTVLVLDGPSITFKGWFDYYSHHVLDAENQFQTIMCVPTRTLDLAAIRWQGWDVVRTEGSIVA